MRYIAVIYCLFISVSLVFAEEEESSAKIIITANRIETPAEKVASSVTVITEEDIQKSQQTQLLEVLKGVPGVDVVRSGGIGGNTSVFLRGANSEHTLVLVDGIEVNNPGSNAGFFDFANFTVDNIERIEILRGPQNLYGSNAIGGVISIFTKKGSGEPSAFFSAEAGSFYTFIEKAGLSGSSESVNYSFTASRHDTKGISAANSKDGNREKDEYDNTTFSGRLGVAPCDFCDLNFFLRYTDANSAIDNSGGVGGDDPNRKLDNEQFFFRTEAIFDFFDEVLTQKYGVSITDHTLEDENDPDSDHPGEILRSNFEGSLVKVDLQNIIRFEDAVSATVGLETEKEKASSFFFSDGLFGPFENSFGQEEARTNGFYAQALGTLNEYFSATIGARLDDHSRFGSEVTYQIAPVVAIPNTGTRITANVGTGFKAPSLFQLFSSFGNRDLNPEESFGWDLGVEQTFLEDTVVIGGTFFRNDIEELITFDNQTFVFKNTSEADITGFEFFARANLYDLFTVGVDYTYTDTEDQTTKSSLLRRPRNKFGFKADYLFLEGGNVGVDVVYVGNRFDNDFSTFPATQVKLSSYTVVNLRAQYRVTDYLEVFARVENLFDKDYEEVLGFGTPGIGGFGGVRVTL